jgi:hypothetical protein
MPGRNKGWKEGENINEYIQRFFQLLALIFHSVTDEHVLGLLGCNYHNIS